MIEKREIKFRFFKPSENKMIYPYPSGKSDGSFLGKFTDLVGDEDWIVMQFTGKQDDDGVDIYEGDILEFDKLEHEIYAVDISFGDNFYFEELEHENIGVVSWDNEECCWCFGGGGAYRDMKFGRKIGNIYENQELLKAHAIDNPNLEKFLKLK